MARVTGLVVGLVLLALGVQGGIRVVVDHDNGGSPRWLGGGFEVWLGGHVILAVAGLALAAWGSKKS